MTLDYREILYTPAHRLYMWDTRLRLAQAEQQEKKFVSESVENTKVDTIAVNKDENLSVRSVPKVVPIEHLGFEF